MLPSKPVLMIRPVVERVVVGLALAVAVTMSTLAPAGWDGARADDIQLGEVLASSARHAPRILETLSMREAARGEALTAEGAFDTRIGSEGFGRFSGFWDGRVVDATVSQDLRRFGITLFGGYRISDRRFPIYEDQYFTNTGGELKAGFILSLLRDRAFDKERAGLVDAAETLRAADLEVLLAQIGVQHRAVMAYYNWLAAGRQLSVYQDLLDIALKREQALERTVQAGDTAEVLLVENRENILRRQSLVVEAERQLAEMSQLLSLYLRDGEGRPAIPAQRDLPDGFPPLPGPAAAENARDLSEARPELVLIDTKLAKARNKLRLAGNDLMPRLDFRYEVGRDFGSVAEGGSSRVGTDIILSVVFSMPLQRREAKGRMASARAEMEALEWRRQSLEEQIAVEIRTLRMNLNASFQMVRLAEQEEEQARIMQRLERTRFENGISNFFLVNTREERTADARIRRIGATLRHFITVADYDAAVVNVEALGLAP